MIREILKIKNENERCEVHSKAHTASDSTRFTNYQMEKQGKEQITIHLKKITKKNNKKKKK